MDIKPIETRYKGYRFRSRLEARWAVFFDALGVKWQYEPEGFKTAHGPYLPDFWLPALDALVEIKPLDLRLDNAWPEPAEAAKLRAAAEAMGELRNAPIAAVMMCGTPGQETVYVYAFDLKDDSAGESWWKFGWTVVGHLRQPWPTPFCDYEKYSNGEIRRTFYRPYSPYYTAEFNDPSLSAGGVEYPLEPSFGDERFLYPAYEAARSARFEHGETP